MSITVTGATGHLGRLIVESLLRRGVPSDQITALGRNVAKATDLSDRGVAVVPVEYDDVESLRRAFADTDALMFVSGSETGKRVRQHRNVVSAAKEVGVGLIAYTSISNADSSTMMLAAEHEATEHDITNSGLPHIFLRNSWYLENYTSQLPTYLEHGITGAAGDGKVSAATRADFAEAAAAALTTGSHANQVYELGGPPFTMTELAAEISRQTGKRITYTDLPVDKYIEFLVAAGTPQSAAELIADGDRGVARGYLHVEGNDLERLIGRPPTSFADASRAAL
ncbi:SDR family oxidoreductase [Phytohabitans kaempferiae]|uniref:SDR family oxidoreductase n=1 Tax=Phytohabitans kaempferiae TaxID=1620943 RepID=A0ABV6MCE4_9ACTN